MLIVIYLEIFKNNLSLTVQLKLWIKPPFHFFCLFCFPLPRLTHVFNASSSPHADNLKTAVGWVMGFWHEKNWSPTLVCTGSVLRSCILAIRPVVVFSHSVTSIRGLLVHQFSWVHLTLDSSKPLAALMLLLPCSPAPTKKDEKHGGAVKRYWKLKIQMHCIQLSKKMLFSVRSLLALFLSLWNCTRERTQLIFTWVDIFTKSELV